MRDLWWRFRRWFAGTDLLVPDAYRQFDHLRVEWEKRHPRP